MDRLTEAATLDPKYFEKHADFKDDYKSAAKDDDNNKVDPFDDAVFLQACFEHALAEGTGFHDWLYPLYADVRASLSDEIQDQTEGVDRGDLVGLLNAVKLAVHHYESLDPDDLEIAYTQCTMASEGANDVMKYLAVNKRYMQRLAAAGLPVRDSKAQRVLLKGLDQTVYEAFIINAERTSYDNYAALVKAVIKISSQPAMLAKLQVLKPGTSQTTLMTRAVTLDPVSARLDKMEALLVTMAKPGQQATSRGGGATRATSVHSATSSLPPLARKRAAATMARAPLTLRLNARTSPPCSRADLRCFWVRH